MIGNTNNYPLRFALALRRRGIHVELFVTDAGHATLHQPHNNYPEWAASYPDWIHNFQEIKVEDVIFESPRFREMVKGFPKRADLAILNDFGPAIAHYLKCPHVAWMTGSDLDFYADYKMVNAVSKGWSSEFKRSSAGRGHTKKLVDFVANQRDGILTSEMVFHPHIGLLPNADELLGEIGVLPNARAMLYIADTENLDAAPKSTPQLKEILYGCRIENPSKQKQGVHSAIDHKGFERFIAGFAQYKNLGGQAKLKIVKKGGGVSEAIKLVKKLGISDSVIWLEVMSLDKFYDEMRNADLICDQVWKSFPGMITLDAYALGKPVLANFRNEVFENFFPEPLFR
jgi:glycosyltransferase involved in cell wall biosynthesis